MKSKSKKLLSGLLATAMIFSLFAAMPLTASAVSSDTTIDLSEGWFGSTDQSAPGGTSWEYIAASNTIKVHDDVSVIGDATGGTKTLGLEIDSGVTAIWKAEYSGSANPLIKLSGSGEFEIAQDGVLNNTGTGFTIDITGTVSVHVSGGTVRGGKAINATGGGPSVKVSGGTVESSGNNSAISVKDKIEISGGTVKATGDSMTVSSQGDIVISGGTVINTGTGVAVYTGGSNASITISDGVVQSDNNGQTIINSKKMTMSGGTVRNTGSSHAIATSGKLDINGGTVSATEGYGIHLLGGADVKVKNGFVFAYKTNAELVVHKDGVSIPLPVSGNAMVCAWNKAAGHTEYTEGTSADLSVSAGTAVWGIEDSKNGIRYANGNNKGFFPIDGITIKPASAAAFTVKFNSNNGSNVASQSVNPGGKATKPADPTRTGYSFAGWYTEETLTTAYDFNKTVTADITLYAKWTENTAAPTPTPTASPTPSAAQKKTITLKINDPYMYVNGVKQEIDPGRGTVPMIVNSRTILPIRAIVEAMGGRVGWDDPTRTVTLAANGHNVTMWLDKFNLVVDGRNLTMDVAPVSINSRTMVPLRFAAENLGCDVEWIGATKEVIVIY